MTTSHALDGRSLTAGTVAAIAAGGERTHLSRRARERNREAAETAQRLMAEGAFLYGRNTGVGLLLDREVTAAESSEHSLRLLRSHASGAGSLLSREVARATLAIRANQLGAGGGGVDPRLHQAMIDALNAGLAPALHEVGSIGIGDVTALAEIGLALLGEGAWLGGGSAPVAQIGTGDAIVLMSSNACTLGEAALSSHRLDGLLRSAEAVAALAFLAARADPVVLDERVQAARPHPGQRATARHLRELVGADIPPARRQDPLCLRCLPQVHGAARDAHRDLAAVLAVELNAAAENPLIDPIGGAALTSGNFHGAPLALALDHVRGAVAQTAAQSVQRVSVLLDGRSPHLPLFLAGDQPGASGAMILEYSAHGALAELRAVAAPVVHASSVVARGQEDHTSSAWLAARQLTRTLEHYVTVLAVELVAAIRAVRLGGSRPPEGPGQRILELGLAHLPDRLEDRELATDLEVAARLIDSGALAQAARAVPPRDPERRPLN